ncbi:MAG: hypothetical protein ACFCD0_30345 [Gemmataceae bacterium]
MKKYITGCLICLTLLLGVASTSQAGLFGFWKLRHAYKYSMFIAVRPYNAFTPVCRGRIFCDGCCPSFGGCGFSGCFPQLPPAPPPPPMLPMCFGYGHFPPYGPGGYCHGECPQPTHPQVPPPPATAPSEKRNQEQYSPPAPTPMPSISQGHPQPPMPGYGAVPIHPVSYRNAAGRVPHPNTYGYEPRFYPHYNPYGYPPAYYPPHYGYGYPSPQ